MKLPLAIILSSIISSFFLIYFWASPQLAKAILAIGIGCMFLLGPLDFILPFTVFLSMFPIGFRYFGTTANLAILVLFGVIVFRAITNKNLGFFFRRLFRNPFFLTSLFILLSYFISLVNALLKKGPGHHEHIVFFISILCALLLANLIIGYIDSPNKLRYLEYSLLALLILNLIFAFLTLLFPGLKFSLLYTSGTKLVGGEETKAYRLGAINFYGEGYGEYLMMVVVFLSSMLCQLKKLNKQTWIIIGLLVVSVIELLLTNTRGAIVMAVAGIFLAVIFFTDLSPLRKVTSILLLGVLILVAFYIADSTGYLKLSERFQNFTEVVDTDYGKLPKARAMTWVPALNQIMKDHFLGSGPSFYPLTRYEGGYGNLVWPHNVILLILATVGFYGLAAYGYLFLRFLISIRHIPNISDYYKAFYKSLWLTLLVLVIETQKFDGLLRKANSSFYLFWILLGIYFSLYNFRQKSFYKEGKTNAITH